MSIRLTQAGTEDFIAPEYIQMNQVDAYDWTRKPYEICFPLNKSWGYVVGELYVGIEKVMEWKQKADDSYANLLVNIGLKGDGAIEEEDIQTFQKFGKKLRK